VIAHQWRQPLNSLALSLQNLRYRYRDGLVDTEFVDRFVGKNVERINFLSQTIEDFRNFFHVSKGKEYFSVRKAIEAIFSMYSLDLRKNHIQYRIEGEDFEIYGSRSEFQQVILNLIANAKEALQEKEGEKRILVKLKEGEVLFEDNAGEPDDEVLERLFESYYTTKPDGSGIGLYISRQIVEERFGGGIRAEKGESGLRLILDFRRSDDQ
jgi:signal transduction histidine kinase